METESTPTASEAATQDTSEPVQDTTEPVQDTPKPVQDTTEPVQDTSKPVEDTTEPVQDTATPTQDKLEPVQDEAKPEPMAESESTEKGSEETAQPPPSEPMEQEVSCIILEHASVTYSGVTHFIIEYMYS